MTDTLPAGQSTARGGGVDDKAGRYVLEIVIPVYNEEHDLPACVRRLHEYLVNDVPSPDQVF